MNHARQIRRGNGEKQLPSDEIQTPREPVDEDLPRLGEGALVLVSRLVGQRLRGRF
jgi:hypothetical protein